MLKLNNTTACSVQIRGVPTFDSRHYVRGCESRLGSYMTTILRDSVQGCAACVAVVHSLHAQC
eukprot:21084-Heterococcus_DN1.PRE.2